MKTIAFCLTILFLAALPLAVQASDDAYWTYEGHYGPENWGVLNSKFAVCNSGMEQSPVDLPPGLETRLAEIELHWGTLDWTVLNTGHTVSLRSQSAGYAIIDDEQFALIDIHFHTPSEHAISGRKFPMEAHFVHEHADGRLAVIGVMMKGGGRHDGFERVMANTPAQRHDNNMVRSIDVASFVTDLGDLLRYQGSLTTPPCSETVMWSVLTDPLVVSDAAIQAFSLLFGTNARPLQPLNRRYVLTD